VIQYFGPSEPGHHKLLTMEDIPLIRDALRGEEESGADAPLVVEIVVTVFPGDDELESGAAVNEDRWVYPGDGPPTTDDLSDNLGDGDGDDG
jgi:hypothetical protein